MAPKHTRANLGDINLEDIDFEVVKECTDKDVVKHYIKLLEDDGSYFHELLNACKEKLLEVCPKDYYLLYPRVATSTEVDDVTRDLLDWEQSVKETDAALRASRKKKIWDDLPGAGVKAPIRGQEPVLTRPNLQRQEVIKDQDQKTVTKRDEYARDKTKMKDYYNKWDQVDVDALEQEMDQEEADAEEARRKHFENLREEQGEMHNLQNSPVKTSDLPEGVPEAHRRHMADSEKEKGNEAYYSKDYEEAEAYYSRSLHFRADDPSCWANRALARLKLENASGALEDCEHALAVNPRYMKALHRKGKALYELQRYEEAVQCFQLALMESPGNTQINGDLMHARRKLRSDGPAPPGRPTTFAPPSRSRNPRDESSCVIEEIFDDEDEAGGAVAKAPAPGYTRVQIDEDSDSEEEAEAAPSSSKPGFHKVQIQEDSEDSEEGEPERKPTAIPRAPAAASGFHKVVVEEASDSEEDAPLASATAGLHKVQIVEGSDSEEEEPSAAVHSTAPAPEAGTADEDIDFGGMD